MNSIKEHLDHLDVDVSRAVASYYILKTIHREASRRSDIRQVLIPHHGHGPTFSFLCSVPSSSK